MANGTKSPRSCGFGRRSHGRAATFALTVFADLPTAVGVGCRWQRLLSSPGAAETVGSVTDENLGEANPRMTDKTSIVLS